MEDQHEEAEVMDAGQDAMDVPQAAAMPVTAPPQTDFGDDLGDPMMEGDPVSLSALYELTMPVAIELGRTRMSVQEILGLGRGSVIQLDRLAGEPIDVFVGDRRFAEGEVVVVGEQFGVRVTRVLQTGPKAGAEAVA